MKNITSAKTYFGLAMVAGSIILINTESNGWTMAFINLLCIAGTVIFTALGVEILWSRDLLLCTKNHLGRPLRSISELLVGKTYTVLTRYGPPGSIRTDASLAIIKEEGGPELFCHFEVALPDQFFITDDSRIMVLVAQKI